MCAATSCTGCGYTWADPVHFVASMALHDTMASARLLSLAKYNLQTDARRRGAVATLLAYQSGGRIGPDELRRRHAALVAGHVARLQAEMSTALSARHRLEALSQSAWVGIRTLAAAGVSGGGGTANPPVPRGDQVVVAVARAAAPSNRHSGDVALCQPESNASSRATPAASSTAPATATMEQPSAATVAPAHHRMDPDNCHHSHHRPPPGLDPSVSRFTGELLSYGQSPLSLVLADHEVFTRMMTSHHAAALVNDATVQAWSRFAAGSPPSWAPYLEWLSHASPLDSERALLRSLDGWGPPQAAIDDALAAIRSHHHALLDFFKSAVSNLQTADVCLPSQGAVAVTRAGRVWSMGTSPRGGLASRCCGGCTAASTAASIFASTSLVHVPLRIEDGIGGDCGDGGATGRSVLELRPSLEVDVDDIQVSGAVIDEVQRPAPRVANQRQLVMLPTAAPSVSSAAFLTMNDNTSSADLLLHRGATRPSRQMRLLRPACDAPPTAIPPPVDGPEKRYWLPVRAGDAGKARALASQRAFGLILRLRVRIIDVLGSSAGEVRAPVASSASSASSSSTKSSAAGGIRVRAIGQPAMTRPHMHAQQPQGIAINHDAQVVASMSGAELMAALSRWHRDRQLEVVAGFTPGTLTEGTTMVGLVARGRLRPLTNKGLLALEVKVSISSFNRLQYHVEVMSASCLL